MPHIFWTKFDNSGYSVPILSRRTELTTVKPIYQSVEPVSSFYDIHCARRFFVDLNIKRPGITSDGSFRSKLIGGS